MKILSAILLAGILTTQAYADEPVKSNCKQPNMPNPQASDIIVKYFNKHRDEYEQCIDKFVKEQQAISKTSTVVTTVNAAHDAAEAAIKEYNDYMELLKQRNSAVSADQSEE